MTSTKKQPPRSEQKKYARPKNAPWNPHGENENNLRDKQNAEAAKAKAEETSQRYARPRNSLKRMLRRHRRKVSEIIDQNEDLKRKLTKIECTLASSTLGAMMEENAVGYLQEHMEIVTALMSDEFENLQGGNFCSRCEDQ